MGRFVGRAIVAVLVAASIGCGGLTSLYDNNYIGLRDYSGDPSARFEEVDLAMIMARPEAARDVEFDAIFRQQNEVVWAPHYTVFVPETYASFSVWPISARLWEVAGRVSYCPTLFIRKYGNTSFSEYMQLKRYERVHVRGTVESTFDNRPWIRVLEISRSGGPVYDDETLAILLAGLNDADEKRHGSAIRHLNTALEGLLSPVAEAAAHVKLGWLYEFRGSTTRKMEDWDEAESHYTAAMSLDPKNEQARYGAMRASKARERGGVGSPPPDSGSTSSGGGAASADWKGRYDSEAAMRRKADEDLKAAANARTAAEADATAARSEVATANRQLADLKASSEKLQAEIDAMRKSMSEGGDASKLLADKITALEGEKATLDEQVKALSQERDDLKKMQGGDEELKKAIAQKEADMAKLVEERDALQKKLSEMPAGGAEAEDLKKQIAGMNDTIDTQKQVISSLREDKEKLEKEVEELKKKLEEKKE